ncbi:MAG: TVP38/TMEM64 family protein [Granulosicoccus sp.]
MKKRTKFALMFFSVAALVVIWSWLPLSEWVDHIRAWVLSLGALGIVLFIVAYILLTAVLAPVSLLSITAGLAYGLLGVPLVVLSATLAAVVAFLLGRYLAHEKVSRWVERDPRLSSLNTAVSEQGWKVVFLVRLSPLIPFGLQNYLFSLTGVKVVPYAIATAVGILPGSALYVYIGVMGQAMDGAGTIQWVLLSIGLISTVLVAWFVGRRASQVLAASQL